MVSKNVPPPYELVAKPKCIKQVQYKLHYEKKKQQIDKCEISSLIELHS